MTKDRKQKKIEHLKRKISKWTEQKKLCPKAYDKELCISRLNQMIQDARNQIKKLQGKEVKPLPVYGPYLEQYLRQLQGPPTEVTVQSPYKALRAPTKGDLLASKRKQTAFKVKYPGTGENYKSTGKQFVRKSPVKEDAGAQLAMAAGVATGAIAAALIAWAHKKYEEWYGKANKACGKMKGSEGRLCRQNFKVQAAKAEIQALKFARSKCRRAKDPKVCVQQLNDKVRQLMDKYPDIEYTMKAIAKHKQESINVVAEIENILLGRK